MIFLLFSRLLVILQLNMFTIIQKELRQFFSGLLGYLSIGVFLLITGILLFIIPESGILDAGYASMDSFFTIAPYIMLFLIHCMVMLVLLLILLLNILESWVTIRQAV